MQLEKTVSMIFPSKELGRKVASEDARTQCQVLEGFASQQLIDSAANSQPIINLVALLPSETVLWFVRVYQEIVNQEELPKSVIEYNKRFLAEAVERIKHKN